MFLKNEKHTSLYRTEQLLPKLVQLIVSSFNLNVIKKQNPTLFYQTSPYCCKLILVSNYLCSLNCVLFFKVVQQLKLNSRIELHVPIAFNKYQAHRERAASLL